MPETMHDDEMSSRGARLVATKLRCLLFEGEFRKENMVVFFCDATLFRLFPFIIGRPHFLFISIERNGFIRERRIHGNKSCVKKWREMKRNSQSLLHNGTLLVPIKWPLKCSTSVY